jgi:predicted alpha/beta hydrolase
MRCAPDEIDARTTDGVTLKIDRLRPPNGTPRGAVVCLHAMMTDGRYFGARKSGDTDSFAHVLAKAGFEVFVADFRGHGRSQPPTAKQSDWSFDDLVELDLPAIVTACASAASCSTSDLVLLGHSLGGLVSTAALGTGRIPSPRLLVLASTSVWLPGPKGPFARRAVMGVYRAAAQLLGYAPIRRLRVGTADEAATYVRQLTGWAQSARWTSLRGVDYTASAETITTPVLPFCGAGDWMCTPRDAAAFLGHLPCTAELRVVGTRRGDALDPDHFQLFTRDELTPMWHELVERLH